MQTRRFIFPDGVERVVHDVVASEALPELMDRFGHRRAFIVCSRTIRRTTVRLLRDSVVVYEGRIETLKRFKDDVSEVRQGFECGISLERFQDVKVGDVIEAYTTEEVAPTSL